MADEKPPRFVVLRMKTSKDVYLAELWPAIKSAKARKALDEAAKRNQAKEVDFVYFFSDVDAVIHIKGMDQSGPGAKKNKKKHHDG